MCSNFYNIEIVNAPSNMIFFMIKKDYVCENYKNNMAFESKVIQRYVSL